MDIEEVKINGFMKKMEKRSIMTSVRISTDFFFLCKEHKIQFSEAIRVGIAILLAEKGVKEYDNHLNLYRKMRQFQKIAEESTSKALELERKIQEIERIKPKDEKKINT